jgi:hypothetical protein
MGASSSDVGSNDCEKLRGVCFGRRCLDSCHIGYLQSVLPDNATVKRQTIVRRRDADFARNPHAEVADGGQFAGFKRVTITKPRTRIAAN